MDTGQGRLGAFGGDTGRGHLGAVKGETEQRCLELSAVIQGGGISQSCQG